METVQLLNRKREAGRRPALSEPLRRWLHLRQRDDDNLVTYELQVPGYRRRDVRVEVRGRIVIVRGERTGGFLSTRSKRSFVYSFELPESLDETDVQAAFGGEVLKVTVGKKPHARRRQISIRTHASQDRQEHPRTSEAQPWRRLGEWFRSPLARRTGRPEMN